MISYSLSFGARARCKYCAGRPKYVSCVFSGNLNKDVLEGLQKSINYQARKVGARSGIASVNYLFLPKKNLKLSHTSTNIAFASVDLKRYKNILPKKDFSKFVFKASYSCDCFRTAWQTRDLILLEKSHISQRLSFKCYPNSIIVL